MNSKSVKISYILKIYSFAIPQSYKNNIETNSSTLKQSTYENS